MTVYSHLLSQALAEDDSPDLPVGDLISSALAWREGMNRSLDAAGRLTSTLAYDLTLIRLCRHFGVQEELTGSQAGPVARARAEEALAQFVPTLGAVVR